MLQKFSLFGRRMASAGWGKPEIISRRASGMFLLWQEASRPGVAVAVISAPGYSGCRASEGRSGIASRHDLWRRAWLSKWAVAGGIFFWRTSAMTCHWRRRACPRRRDSEGTRPAPLLAGPVPERSNVKTALYRNVLRSSG